MKTEQNPRAAKAQHTPDYWFDPAVAQYDPSKPDSLWCCSIRGMNGGVIAWAEGETPEETRARCATICRALNATGSMLSALNLTESTVALLIAQSKEDAEDLPMVRNWLAQVRAAIASATQGSATP